MVAVEETTGLSLLILNLDGTVREPLSNNKFIQRPRDQQIIKGAIRAIAYFASSVWNKFLYWQINLFKRSYSIQLYFQHTIAVLMGVEADRLAQMLPY